MDHAQVAQRILPAIGGEDNILGAAHCATRLRLVLRDSEKVNTTALDDDPDLKGTFEAGGMFQIIVGPGDVDIVFDELTKLCSKNIAVSTEELKNVATKKGNPFSRGIKVLADIFVPLIPILVGGGLLMALNNVLTAPDLFGPLPLVERYPALGDTAGLINLLASAPFAFLPILVGFTATKRFGGNEYLGAGIGMAMVMPDLVNGYSVAEAMSEGTMSYWHIFGIDVAQAGYQGTVLPVLVVAWILATIEKFLHRHLRGTVDFLVTPVLSLLVTGFLTFMAVGPVMRVAGEWLGMGLANLYEFGGPVGGFLFGLVYSPIVITGLHQSFPPIELELISQGGSFIFPTASMANIAQGAATLAIFLLAKNEKLKGLSGAAGASAVVGITEPAIFGVNLRLRWPFYIGMGSAALGSALVAIFHVKGVALGAAGFLGAVSIRSSDIPMFLVCSVITFVISFGASLAYGKLRGNFDADAAAATPADLATPAEAEPAAPAPAPAAGGASSTDTLTALGTVAAPLTGDVLNLAEVSDPMFAGGKLGSGMAIVPTEGRLVAPFDGKVIVSFPSGHAFAVRSIAPDGTKVDVLMHIGFDTVELKGEHFRPLAQKGDEVKAGETLCEFDIPAIRAAGYDITTPVVVTKGSTQCLRQTGESVRAGEPLYTVHPAS